MLQTEMEIVSLMKECEGRKYSSKSTKKAKINSRSIYFRPVGLGLYLSLITLSVKWPKFSY